MDGTERAIYALEDYMRERGIEWEEHETCDDESQVEALLGHLKSAPILIEASEAIRRLREIEEWVEAQSSPFLADAAANLSQAIHDITIYKRLAPKAGPAQDDGNTPPTT